MFDPKRLDPATRERVEYALDNVVRAFGWGIALLGRDLEPAVSRGDFNARSRSYCTLIRADETRKAECVAARRAAVEKYSSWAEPFLFTCPAGLIEGIAPLYDDGQLVGFVAVGPALFPRGEKAGIETARNKARGLARKRRLDRTLAGIERVDAARFKAGLNLVHALFQSIIGSVLGRKPDQEAAASIPASRRGAALSNVAQRRQRMRERMLFALTRTRNRKDVKDTVRRIVDEDQGRRGGAGCIESLALVATLAIASGRDRDGVQRSLSLASRRLLRCDDAEEKAVHMVTFVGSVASVRPDSPPETVAALGAARWIRDNLTEQIRQTQIAAAAGMSVGRLGRLMTRQLGVSPWEYLVIVRVLKAKEMLKRTKLPVSEIGRRVGFTDQSNFSKAFKSVQGVSPTQFRHASS